MILKTHTTHLRLDKYQSHQNSSISLVQMRTTYITNIQRIVLQYLRHMRESMLSQRASELRKCSKIN